MWRSANLSIPSAEEALPGRRLPVYHVHEFHAVNGRSMLGQCPESLEECFFGMGCFWGAERKFWQAPGVYATAVGYGAGHTVHPTYEEVCTGLTGHNELVRVWFDPQITSFSTLLKLFWESHNPTQGMRQGNDVGTQYRSGIYVTNDAQYQIAQQSMTHYQQRLTQAGFGRITTEIDKMPVFYLAETYHQQYLAKNPNGYCGLGGCQVCFDDANGE